MIFLLEARLSSQWPAQAALKEKSLTEKHFKLVAVKTTVGRVYLDASSNYFLVCCLNPLRRLNISDQLHVHCAGMFQILARS